MPGLPAGLPGLMAGYLLRTSIVLIAALIAAAAARRRPAAFRHFILTSALTGLLLLPLLTLVPAGWRSPLVPAWMGIAEPRPAEAPKSAAVELTALAPENGGDHGALRVGGRFVLTPVASGSPRLSGKGPLFPRPDQTTAGSTDRTSGLPAFLKKTPSGTIGLLLAVLWAAGVAVLLLRLAFGLSGAVRLTAEGKPLDDASWRVLLDRFLAFASLRRQVRLRSHPEVLVPLTWGFRRPIVLFPDGAGDWNEDERSSALYHELSHIKRADFLAMLLVRTSLALFWWNPLCWIVYREILKEQEIACDELVLRAGIRPSIYAASLLAFRRSAGLRWNPSAALLGMLGRSSFQERLAAILKQKLTSMEVKMKTKIMLALVLVAAVALIGTARPAVGNEKSAVKVSLAATAAPAAATLEAVPTAPAPAAVQADHAAAQEKQKEQEKAKAAEKAKEAEKAAEAKAATAKTIVIKPVGEEGEPIEVTITEGDTTKTLVLEKSLTITKDKDGKILILTPEGKEPIMLKGEPLRLEIKGGGLEVIREGKPLDIGEGGVYRIVRGAGEEGGKIVFYGTTEPKIAEGKFMVTEKTEAGEARPEVIVKRTKEIKPGEKWVAEEAAKEGQTVRIVRKGEAGTAWTVVEPEKGEAVWVAKEVAGEPLFEKRFGRGDRAFAFPAAPGKEMLEKIQALEEQVQAIKAKKMDLSALEESLKTLEAELKAKEEKFKTFSYKFDQEPVEYVFSKKSGEKEGEINLMLTGHDGEAGQAAFERAVTKLRRDLPEGYKLIEQKYDPENGGMFFKIAGPEGKKTDEALVKKLVDSLRTEIDKK